jgi:hypothetical protein
VPQIIVRANHTEGDSAVLYRERVDARELESDHFARHLIERLGWALVDAAEVEDERRPDGEPRAG